jgi:hypothetical protein
MTGRNLGGAPALARTRAHEVLAGPLRYKVQWFRARGDDVISSWHPEAACDVTSGAISDDTCRRLIDFLSGSGATRGPRDRAVARSALVVSFQSQRRTGATFRTQKSTCWMQGTSRWTRSQMKSPR